MWEESLGTNNIEWNVIFGNIYQITSSTKLQFFQLQILHRCLTTNTKLFYFGIKDHNRCTFCNLEMENILHLFWECKKVKSLWLQIFDWMTENLNINIAPCDKYIILNQGHLLIDSIVIISKYFIYKCRCEDKELNFKNLKAYLMYQVNIEITGDTTTGAERWAPLLQPLGLELQK